MLDIKFIRENSAIVKKDLEKRKDEEKIKWVDDLLAKDEEYRKLLKESEDLKHKRNVISEEINKLKKEGQDISAKVKEMKEIPGKIKEVDSRIGELRQQIRFYQMRIPNILHESVPYGASDKENVEIKRVGEIKAQDFELKSHGQLIEDLDMGNFKRATKISGAGFYYLKGDIALLDRALTNFAIDFLVQEKGFTFIMPPYMMNKKAYEGVTDLADFENVMYKVDGEDMYLIATSEHPMVSMYMNEVVEDLPIKFCGYSPCFRREIGSHGVDTRGLFRVHQFNKIEQVIICKPEDSWKIHEEIQQNSEKMFEMLGLPFRVVNICTGDIGSVASKKYDIEAWFPRQQKYAEVTSASNCTAYQAVRLNIRYEDKGEREYVHTLNNTGIAIGRCIVCILENYQNKDGSVTIPEVLRKYMGKDKIEAVKK